MPDENFKPTEQTLAELQRDLNERMKLNDTPPAAPYWDQFVPKEYEMDPKTEDVLYAERLRDGMVVLIEQDRFRENITHIQKFGNPTAIANANALKNNRWTTVSNLTKYSENEITFIGVYPDGQKTQHVTRLKQAWYVKFDSIPEEDPLAKEEAELKEALASLVETSKIAWQNILDMLKQGVKAEADLLDEAAERLRNQVLEDDEEARDLEESERIGEEFAAKGRAWLAENAPDRLPPEPDVVGL